MTQSPPTTDAVDRKAGKKILGLVTGCLDCPRRSYYSGGIYNCAETQHHLPPRSEIERITRPGWCPLIDYPIAAQPSWPAPVGDDYARGIRDALDIVEHYEKGNRDVIAKASPAYKVVYREAADDFKEVAETLRGFLQPRSIS